MVKRRRTPANRKNKLSNNQLASLALAALIVSSVGTFLMLDSGALDTITGLPIYNTSGNLTVVVAAAVACTLTNNSVVIGPLFPGGSEATDVNGTPTLLLNNTGNRKINVSINSSDATGLFLGTAVAGDYQIKAGNKCYGHGNVTSSAFTIYTNAIAGSHRRLIQDLNFTKGNNSCDIDFNITIPTDEPAGNRTDIIGINCTAV